MYRFRSKLVCLSKQGNETDNIKDANLLPNLFIFCQLQIRYALQYGPQVFGEMAEMHTKAKCSSLLFQK